jgi:uncharacterized membrane protein
MLLHTWRRKHGPDTVCQAKPVDGIGTWRVSAWLVSNATVAVTLPTAVKMLEFAHAKADALARNTFGHTCEVETCGQWLPQ